MVLERPQPKLKNFLHLISSFSLTLAIIQDHFYLNLNLLSKTHRGAQKSQERYNGGYKIGQASINTENTKKQSRRTKNTREKNQNKD